MKITEVVEETLFLESGSVHRKFTHFVQQPGSADGSEMEVTC
jgi:hypothetical protein